MRYEDLGVQFYVEEPILQCSQAWGNNGELGFMEDFPCRIRARLAVVISNWFTVQCGVLVEYNENPEAFAGGGLGLGNSDLALYPGNQHHN